MSSQPQWPKNAPLSEPKGPTSVRSESGERSSPADMENLEEGVQEVHDELRKATITQILCLTSKA